MNLKRESELLLIELVKFIMLISTELIAQLSCSLSS